MSGLNCSKIFLSWDRSSILRIIYTFVKPFSVIISPDILYQSGIIWIRAKQSWSNLWHGFVWFYGCRTANIIWKGKKIFCTRSVTEVANSFEIYLFCFLIDCLLILCWYDFYLRWAAYVAGTILVLMKELGVRFENSISMLVITTLLVRVLWFYSAVFVCLLMGKLTRNLLCPCHNLFKTNCSIFSISYMPFIFLKGSQCVSWWFLSSK